MTYKTPRDVQDSQTATEFELIIGDKGGEILSADIPIRWCVNSSLLKKMDEAGIQDPHVLISVAMNNRPNSATEVLRKIIPLNEVKTYLPLNHAGDFKVMAWIVSWKEEEKAKKNRAVLKKILMSRAGSYSYNTSVFVENYEFYDEKNVKKIRYFPEPNENIEINNKSSSNAFTSKDITVPKTVFGKEPPAWAKWYVNLWHENKPKDECTFRRRTVFAFTLKWIPFIAFAFAKIFSQVVASLLFIAVGWTEIGKWKNMLHPYDLEWVDGLDNSADHQYFVEKDYYVDIGPKFYITPIFFIPVVLIFCGVLTLVGGGHPGWFFGYLILLFSAVVIDAIFFAVEKSPVWLNPVSNGLIYLSSKVMVGYHTTVDYVEDKGWENRIYLGTVGVFGALGLYGLGVILYVLYQAGLLPAFLILAGIGAVMSWVVVSVMGRMVVDVEDNDYMKAQDLLCPLDHENLNTSIETVPIEKRSFRLIYQDVKHGICKPMQW